MRCTTYMSGARVPDSETYALLHGYLGHLELVPADIGDFLLERRGEDVELDQETQDHPVVDRLIEKGFLTERTAAEEKQIVVGISGHMRKSSFSLNPTSFMIVPTVTCNLRCPYCFQSHELHKGKGAYGDLMTLQQLDVIFAAIDRFGAPGAVYEAATGQAIASGRDGVRHTSHTPLTLFGGEPLCAATREIIPHIIFRARQRGMTLSAITNGVELDLFMDQLGPGKIESLQITLDGLMERHDRRRVGPGFKKTFDRIVANTTAALEKGIAISLRINIDQDNLSNISELHAYFREIGWYEFDYFDPYAAAVDSLSPQTARKQVSHLDVYEETQSLRADGNDYVASYEGMAESLVSKCFLKPGEYPFERGETCSAETGQMIFDPLGDIYACWEDVGEPEKRIAIYDDVGVHFDRRATEGWLHRFPGSIDQCSECPYALIHTSGCAAHAREETGTIHASACEGFQEYFPLSLGHAVRRFADNVDKAEAIKSEAQVCRT